MIGTKGEAVPSKERTGVMPPTGGAQVTDQPVEALAAYVYAHDWANFKR